MGMQLHESLMQNSKFHALIISCISTYRNFKKIIEIARKSQNWKATNIMKVKYKILSFMILLVAFPYGNRETNKSLFL